MELTFIERGVIAALFVGLIAPLIGTLLAVRRSSIISESLAHVTLTGISAGVLIGQSMEMVQVNPLYAGFVFSLAGSLIIEKLRQVYPHFQELAAPIILSAGIGISAILMSLANSGYNEWYDYLFGSIVSVTEADLTFIMFTSLLVAALFLLFFKELVSVSFDQEFAKVSGISVQMIHFLFSFLVALVISMSMKVVGILLVGALISLPVAAALQIAKSFRKLLFWSVMIGEIAVMLGVYGSYHFDIATGGVIVVLASFLLLAVMAIKKFSVRL
ncbi:metal ABC transporter permease [Salibacterium salarium]|uniref:Metal ABC transporter permease n=1 Tax=Salibacterium salarium TaxID=284579 RepID=A0A3R9P4H7_9BACI|nr:metal ABC transporter permease [Salibacterium salarium]RSL30918.1 metal ABC transporter permease [Salibacterium salarium]